MWKELWACLNTMDSVREAEEKKIMHVTSALFNLFYFPSINLY